MSKEMLVLLDQILALPDEERASLIVGAMESFAYDDEIADDHAREALSRVEGYRAGKIGSISEEEALRLIATDV